MVVMLVYWAEEYVLQRKREALIVASKKNGLAVNADKTIWS